MQKTVLPSVRTELARVLRAAGLSQNEIARAMDVTQAAVSKYLSASPTGPRDHDTESLCRRLAEVLINGAPAEAIRMLCGHCMKLRMAGSTCGLHRQMVPSIASSDCDICGRLVSGEEGSLTDRTRVLSDMRAALDIMQASRAFSRLVPQVRANLVTCTSDASSLTDVAGVPGRITVVAGYPRALMSPEFGASTHMAELLLWARRRWPWVRSCLCIGGSNEIVSRSVESGVLVLTLPEPAATAPDIAEQVADRRDEVPPGITVGLHIPGGIGVEPVLYLLGESAVGLVETSLHIAECLEQR
ncbi:MAG: thiamine-phosphate synthase family protein [Candidatus Thorarchaeota archaeon]